MDNNNTTVHVQQDNNNDAQSVNSANTNNNVSSDVKNGIDYGKIQNMIDRGVQQKENAILKSYFEQQGMSEEEVKSAIGDWKAKKQSDAQQKSDDFAKLQQSTQELQARLNRELLEKQAFNDCLDLGVERNTIPYVIKSADFKDAIDDKGEIKADKVREVIEKVLTDVPAFKGTKKDEKGFQIGVNGESEEDRAQEDALRKAFGLAPKK